MGNIPVATGPIGLPTNIKAKDVSRNKNESIFTNSLLAGDSKGYAHLTGGSKHVSRFS